MRRIGSERVRNKKLIEKYLRLFGTCYWEPGTMQMGVERVVNFRSERKPLGSL